MKSTNRAGEDGRVLSRSRLLADRRAFIARAAYRTDGSRVNVEYGHDRFGAAVCFSRAAFGFDESRMRGHRVVRALREPRVERRRHARPRPQPPLRINIAETWQVRWWCDHFGVTHRELFDAIAVVGFSAEAVRRRLGR